MLHRPGRHLMPAAIVASIFSALNASATPITVLNPGFELDTTSSFINGPITDWTTTSGTAGVWNINADPLGFWTALAPQGSNIAFLSDAPRPGTASAISQVLSATLQADTTYTLSGYVGDPIGFSAGTLSTASLFAGATLLVTESIPAPSGTFTPFSLTFDSTGFPLLVGQTLEIQLAVNEPQTGFDAIALDASSISTTSVPEPGTLLLFSGGLAALGLLRRKRSFGTPSR